jgi:hypothetical protein
MIPLDGNAIGGELHDVFGADVTSAISVCEHCGARSFVAESVVYMRGPGTVARCRGCGGLHMVLVAIRGITCVDLRGLASLEMEV